MKKRYILALILALLMLLSACGQTVVVPDGGNDVNKEPIIDENFPDPLPEPTAGITPEPTPEPTPDPDPDPDPEPEPEPFVPFKLAFTGDISIAENYEIYQNAAKKGYAIEDLFSPSILARMRAADLLAVNCESAVSDRGEPLAGKAYTFRTTPETAKGFLTMGADLIGLANNHVYDYGVDAFLDTMDHFENMGLATVGAGINAEAAYTPFYYEKSGKRIAVIAASRAEKYYMTPIAEENAPGIAGCYDSTLVCEAVKKAKEEADFVIVYAHFGAEYKTTIEDVQQKAAYDFIDAGADLIIGAHPHILQGMTSYKGKPIFYSLGNFLFNLKDLDTALLEITFENETDMPKFQLIPCRQIGGQVLDQSGTAHGERILESLRVLSPGVTIDSEGYVTFS